MNDALTVPAVLWQLAGLVCHQLPDRSPHFGAFVFPFCFRCTGLYAGVIGAFAALAMTGGWRRRLPGTRSAVWMSMLMAPLFVDGWAGVLGVWSSVGWVRALTGLGVGLGLPLLLVPLLAATGARGRSNESDPSTASALLPAAAASVALLWLALHPMRAWVFQALAAAASFAPLVFAAVFVLAGWRNRAALAYALGIAPRGVSS